MSVIDQNGVSNMNKDNYRYCQYCQRWVDKSDYCEVCQCCNDSECKEDAHCYLCRENLIDYKVDIMIEESKEG